jgi:hypothetical protein
VSALGSPTTSEVALEEEIALCGGRWRARAQPGGLYCEQEVAALARGCSAAIARARERGAPGTNTTARVRELEHLAARQRRKAAEGGEQLGNARGWAGGMARVAPAGRGARAGCRRARAAVDGASRVDSPGIADPAEAGSLRWQPKKKVLELALTERGKSLYGEVAQARFSSLALSMKAAPRVIDA